MVKHDGTYDVALTYAELQLLDGKATEKVQAVIELAKKEHSIGFDLPIMNEVIQDAEKNGIFRWLYDSGRSCTYCDKFHDYAKYKRSSRYHNKGDNNYGKPLFYRGIQFSSGFVRTANSIDMCLDCCKEHNVLERILKYIIDNDLKIEIAKNQITETKYLKDDKRICYSCNESMYESEMGRRMNVMRDGTYPSTCPHCSAGSNGGRLHKTTKDFRHLLNPKFNVVTDTSKKTNETEYF